MMSRKLYRTGLTLSAALITAMWAMPLMTRGETTVTSEPFSAQRAFRPYGYYSLVGKHPKGLEEFDTIQYWRKDQEQSGPDISERLSGVTADEGVLYRYATIRITRRNFVFTTVKVKGVSYGFSGRFLRTDFVNADLDFDKPVLVGTLTKYRNGRRVARARVTLNYFAGT